MSRAVLTEIQEKLKNKKGVRSLISLTLQKLENSTAKIRATALREMGFDGKHTGGATFVFLHKDPAVKPISEHRPHEEGKRKMPIERFERFVRKMKTQYEWFTMENFELAE